MKQQSRWVPRRAPAGSPSQTAWHVADGHAPKGRWCAFASRLKASAAKLLLPPGARRAPLLFDPLEPRVLLSADALTVDLAASLPAQQDHQVLVRLVETAEQTQSQAASQQRIEIVDQSSGTVLAAADVGSISQVSLLGGGGEDHVTIDAASFAGRAAPVFSFDGGAGDDTIELSGAQDAVWQLGAMGAGTVSGAVVVDFTDVARLIAGSGDDTLKGGAADVDWRVTGNGSGTVGARTFSGFEALVGAADNQDTFTFQSGGAMLRGVDGGAGGFDTLVLANTQGMDVVSMPSGPQSGAMIVGGQTIAYDGLEPITITAQSNSITLNAWGACTLTYSDGTMTLTSKNGEWESQTFTSTGLASVTINAYQTVYEDGAPSIVAAAIDLDLQSVDSSVGALVINANTNATTFFGGDTTTLDFFGLQDDLTQIVRVSGDLGFAGGSLTINAEQVLVGTTLGTPSGTTTGWAESVEYSNVAASGGSGTGMTMDVTVNAAGQASVHIVNAGSGYQVGDTITVTPAGGAGTLSFTVLSVAASAVVDTAADSAASAGAIAINAFDIRIGAGAQLLADGTTSDNTISIVATSENFRYLTLPISWEWNPLAATVDVSNATITGSSVTITATSEDVPGITQSTNFLATLADGYLQGIGSSVVTFLNQYAAGLFSEWLGFSPSLVVHKTSALAAIHDSAVTATGSGGVTISATTNVDASGQAYFSGLKTTDSRYAVAVGFGYVASNAQALITGSTSVSSAGSASVTSSATGTVKVTARASVNLLGAINPSNQAYAIGVEINELTSITQLGENASIAAAGAVTFTSAGSEKTGSSVSTQANIDGNLGISIGVGVSNATVRTVVDGDISAGALQGTDDSFDAATAVTTSSAAADGTPPPNSITIANHGFTTGEQITYNVNGGTPIGGLVDGGQYTVVVIDENTVQLVQVPFINLTPATGDAGIPFTLNAVDASADTIYAPSHGFATGDQVLYSVADGAAAITGLTAGATYTVNVIDSNNFQLQDANGQTVQISQSVAAVGQHAFEGATNALTMNLAAIDAGQDIISIADHGLIEGDPVIYNLSGSIGGDIPGLSDGQTYYVHVIDANNFQLALSVADLEAGTFVGISAGSGPSLQNLVVPWQTMELQAALPFELNAIDSANDTINAPGHGFATGDQVVYTASAGGSAITGLTSGATYTVNVIDDSNFQLLAANGQAIQISQGSAIGEHSFVSPLSGDGVALNLAAIDATLNCITVADHGFTEGQTVAYSNLTGTDETDIGSLGDGTQYVVHVIDANNFQLAVNAADAAAGTFVNVVAVGTQPASTQALVYTAQTFTFDPTTAVNGSNDTITLANHGLKTGDMVQYDVNPNVMQELQSLEVDPDTQEVVGSAESILEGAPQIGGLEAGQTYYVVVVDENTIRLVSSLEDAPLAAVIPLTSAGSGTQYFGAGSALTIGASLSAADSQSASSGIGGTFNYNKYAKGFLSKPDLTTAILKNRLSLDTNSSIVTGVEKAAGADKATTIANNKSSWTGGIGIAVSNHDVAVTIGANVTGTNTTDIISAGTLGISSSIKQSTSMSSSASVSKPDGSNDVTGLGLSIAFSDLHNSATVLIAGAARIDAGDSASISSLVNYPVTTPASLYANFASNIQSKGLGGLTYYDDGMGGLSNLINNSATTSVSGGKGAANSNSLGLSASLNWYYDTSKVTVESGAQINQRSQYTILGQTIAPLPEQSVSISATNAKGLVNAVGQYGLSLNDGLLFKIKKVWGDPTKSLSRTDFASYAVSSSGKGAGLAVLANDYNTDTEAVIEDGVDIGTGSAGSLAVSSSDSLWVLNIAEAGASVSASGGTAFGGSFVVTGQTSTVVAAIQAGDQESTISGGGAVSVDGQVSGTQIAIAGALGSFTGSGKGFSVGVVITDLERSVDSYIGAAPGMSPTAGIDLSGGTVSVSAQSGGTFLTIGLAGTYNSGSSAAAQPSKDPGQSNQVVTKPIEEIGNSTDIFALTQVDLGGGGEAPDAAQPGGGSTGFGLAGSVNVFILDDTTHAYVSTSGTFNVSSLDVAANDGTEVISLVGGAALGLASNEGGSTVIAGAVNVNVVTFDTAATVSGLDDLLSAAAVTVGATNTGSILSVSAGIAVDNNADATWAAAGSVAVNRIGATASALIDSVAALSAAAVTVNSQNALEIYAYGGGLAVSKAKTGVGAGIGINNVTSATTALITGDEAVSNLTVSGALAVTATNENSIQAIGVTADIGTGQQSASIAGTLAVNVITNLDGTPVTAGIRQAAVQAASVSVEAQDTSDILSIAGAIAVGKGATGVGAALSWNEVSIGVDAGIDYAVVETTTGDTAVDASADTEIVAVGVGAAWTRTQGTAVGASLSANVVVKSISATVTSTAPEGNTVSLGQTPTVSSAGDLIVGASDATVITAVNGGVAIAGGESTGAGAAFALNVVAIEQMLAEIDGGSGAGAGLVAEAVGDIAVTAQESSQIVSVAAGFAYGNTSGVGSATISIIDSDNITARVAGPAQVTAGGNVQVKATNDSVIRNIAGDLAIGKQGGSYGVGVAWSHVGDSVTAYVDGDAQVTAGGGATFEDVSGATVSGLSVEAASTQSVTNLGVGGSVSSQGTALNLSLSVSTIDSDVSAYVGAASDTWASPNIVSGADVNLVAVGSTFVVGVGGSMAVSTSGGFAGTAGLDTPWITRNVAAYMGDDNSVTAAGNVVVKAEAATDLWSGSLAVGASSEGSNVAVSAAVTVLTFTTTAYIAGGARVTAQNNVAVTAMDSTDATQISGAVSLALGSGLGVGGSFGLNKIYKTTSAFIDSGAVVTANAQGASLVALTGETAAGLAFTASAIAGNQITLQNHGLQDGQTVVYDAPDGVVGGAIGGLASGQTYYVKVIDADTISLAASAGAPAISLTAPIDPDAVQSLLVVAQAGSSDTQTVASSAVNGNTITATDHGFVTGQQIVYVASGQQITGLQSGQSYYVIVIDANHFQLAASAAGAAAATALTLGTTGIDPSAQQSFAALSDPAQTVTDSSIGLPSTLSFTGQQSGVAAAQKGVIVAAVSTENVKGFGVGLVLSSGLAVPLAGDWTDSYVTTLAYINAGAQINADTSQADAYQDVSVLAGHSYEALLVGAAAGYGSGGAGMAGLARLYLGGVTQAYIVGDGSAGAAGTTLVNARDSVSVTAQASESVISVAAGVGGGSGFAAAGSLSWVGMDLQTQANIDGPVNVLAGGNVLVGANDDTAIVNVGGSIAVGAGGAGIGAGGGVVLVDKLTTANIGGGASVDAYGNGGDTVDVPEADWATSQATHAIVGVAVEASSSETVTNVGGSAGGGSGAGVYGAVTVESIASDTWATISGGAQVNQQTGANADASQAVDVSATNLMDIYSFAGNLAIGGSAGIGASVDVGTFHNNTVAVVGADTEVAARGAVSVNALDDWTFKGHAVGGSAGGAAGISGSVVVLNVGGGVNTTYQTDSNGDGVINNADESTDVSSPSSGDSIGSFLDQSFSSSIQSLTNTNQAPSFNSSTAVDPSDDTIDLGGDYGIATGQAVVYNASGGASSVVGGLQNGKTYYAIVDADDPTRIALAATLADALNGNRIGLTPAAAGATQSFTLGQQFAAQTVNQQVANTPQEQVGNDVLSAAPVANGTTAGIAAGAQVSSGSVSVVATQVMELVALAGAVAGAGEAGIGAGIAIVYVDADVQAYVGAGAVLTGTGGSLTVAATRTVTDLWVLGAAGGGAATFGLGAAVVVINDHSDTTALIGSQPNALEGAATGADISGYGATSISSTSSHTQTLFAGSLGGGIVGVGVTVLHSTFDGDATTEIAAGTVIDATGAVNIEATRTVAVAPPADSLGFMAASIGLALGAVPVAYGGVEVNGDVNVQVDDDVSITSAAAVTVAASDTITTDMMVGSGLLGGVGIGIVWATHSIGNSVNASIGKNGRITGSSVSVNASNTIDAGIEGFGAMASAGLTVGGLRVNLDISSTTTVSVGYDTELSSTVGDIALTTDASITGDIQGRGYGGSLGPSFGRTIIDATVSSANTITIGEDAVLTSADDIAVSAETTLSLDGTAVSGGGSLLVAVDLATASAVVTDATSVTIGDGAALTAADDLSVGSTSSDTVTPYVDATTISTVGGVPEATANVVFTGSTTTTLGNGATLAAETVEITAEIATLDIDPYAKALAGGAYGYMDAEATATVTSAAAVSVGSGASVKGSSSVTLSTALATATTTPTAFADAWNLIATPSATATLTADITAATTVAQTAQIETRALTVGAVVPSSPSVAASGTVSGGLIDIGGNDGASNNTVTFTRQIAFNGTVTMLGAPDPTLTIAASGQVTASGGVTYSVAGNTVTVGAIAGSGGPSAGTITFSLPSSSLDGTSTAWRSLTGAPAINTIGNFDKITIVNNSTMVLQVGSITAIYGSSGLKPTVTGVVGSSFVPTYQSITTPTTISISGASGADILLAGAISNPLGSTTIANSGGNIVQSGGSVVSKTIVLSAAAGSIGSSASPIVIGANTGGTTLTANALNGVYVSAQGALAVASAGAGGGTVSLTAGSLTSSGTGPNVTARTVSLTASNGGIGTSGRAFLVDTQGSGGTFSAQAAGAIFITETSGSLIVNSVLSTAGNVTLTVADSAAAGEDLVLADEALVRSLAANGTVTLQAGDNVLTSATSTVSGHSVTIAGDSGDQDPAAGADIDIRGLIAAATIMVSTGAGADRISVRRLQSGSTMTIDTGGGADRVHLGSTAMPAGATGGVLSAIQGQVILQGSTEDTLVLDDSGNTGGVSATLSATQITGMGLGGTVQWGGLAELALQFGSAADTLTVRGATARVTADLGGGDDQVVLGGSDATLSGFASQLSISGGQGSDSLSIVDTADMVARSVAVSATSILGLTPGNAAGGFFYDGLERVGLSLGMAADTVTVSGTSAATTIDAGGGADALTVGDGLSGIAADLTLQGDGTDTLAVSSEQPANLAVSGAAGQTRITGDAMAGAIAFFDMQSLTLSLSDSADTLSISGNAAPIVVQANGGDDVITVTGLDIAASIDLGTGVDRLTVVDADALLTVSGDAADTLAFDQTTRTSAVTAGAVTGTGVDSGVVGGLTAGDVSFSGVGTVEVLLGGGNDSLTIDQAFSSTALRLLGGGGNDTFLVRAVGPSATVISGGSGADSVTLQIDGTPTDGAFTSLDVDIELLVVDNSANATTAIAWTIDDGEIQAAPIVGGALASVVALDGAASTRILGGSQQDTLSIVSDAGDVEGTIDGDHVELRAGLIVVTGESTASYVDWTHAMTFDGAQTGLVSHVEDGFSLSVSASGGALVRHDSFSPAVTTTNAGDVLTLRSANADGMATGNVFAVHAISLAADADTQITFTGTTANGQAVTTTIIVTGGVGFRSYSLGDAFKAVRDVNWSAGGTAVDNIVAADVIIAQTAPTTHQVKQFQVTGDISFNTTTGTIASGTIVVGSTTLTASSTLAQLEAQGILVSIAGGIARFAFSGDLVIASNVTIAATGANALSLYVGNDAVIGSNVAFNLSASGTTAGAGGGSAGNTTATAGSGGAGGNGGAAASGGAAGNGGEDDGQAGGQGGANAGQTGQSGTAGTSGAAGTSGVNAQNSGGSGGAAGSTSTTVNGGSTGGGGAGGAGGAEGTFVGDDGSDGASGHNGNPGTAGNGGGAATSGGGGSNTGSGLTISGGGGGGAGGSGAGGQGGGGGASGTGGGGGGGGGAGVEDGADGGAGGTGGAGAAGGTGGAGGVGGAGGAGGGALEIVAMGRLSVSTGSTFQARGGNGAAGTSGGSGAAGATNVGAGGSGSSGVVVDWDSGGEGGDGGNGGNGAVGGAGGAGGAGGGGGGGAGGTIKLYATDIVADGISVDTSGGTGATLSGGNGRFIIGGNTSLSLAGQTVTSVGGAPSAGNVTGASTTYAAGPREANAMTAGDVLTPLIAGWSFDADSTVSIDGGAAIYGVLNGVTSADFDYDSGIAGLTAPPTDALVAIFRFDLGPGTGAEDYTGYDMLLYVNLTDIALANPSLGVGEAAQALMTAGFGTNALFGGSGSASVLSALGAHQIWATLIPESATVISASFGGADGTSIGLSSQAIADGQILFLSASVTAAPAQNAVSSLTELAVSPDGQHTYAVSADSNTLVVINADGSTRQTFHDGSQGVVSGIAGASDVTVSPDGRFVYVASSASDSIAIFSRSTATGDLTFVQRVDGAAGTFTTLTMSADGTCLYAGGSDGLAIYTVDAATGALGSPQSVAGLAMVGVSELVESADGTRLFVATASDSLVALDGQTLAVEQTLSGGGLGLDGASDLTLVGSSLYVTSADGGTLSVFDVSGTAVAHLQTLRNGVDGVRGLSEASDVAATGDGQYVLVSGRETSSISVFKRDADNGKLTFVQIVSDNVGGVAGVAAPAALAVDGTRLLVASGQGTLGTLAMDLAEARPDIVVIDYASIEELSLITGAGADTISIVDAPPGEVEALTIETNGGSDRVWVGAAAATTVVDLGDGDDEGVISLTTSGVVVTMNGGDGNDDLSVDRVGENSAVVVSGDAGDDTIEILGANLPTTSGVTAHGGAGDGDVLQFDPQNPTPSTPNYTPVVPTPEAGTLAVIGQGTLTYDGFDDVAVVSAPLITLPATPVTIAEGESLTLTVSITPLGTTNTLQSVQWDFGGDGNFETSDDESITLTWSQLAEIGVVDDGTYSVWVRATNGDGVSTDAQVTFVVTNAGPVITLLGASSAAVGADYTIAFSASDPGNDVVAEWRVDWGDGTVETFGADATEATHVYATPGARSVTVSVRDEDAANYAATAALPVTAEVAAAQVTAGGPYVVVEGAGVTLSANAPGTVSSFAWTVNGQALAGASGSSVTLSWAELNQLGIADDGTFSVSVTAVYPGAVAVTAVQAGTLVVTNAAPTATLLVTPSTVDEGASAVVSFADVGDAGSDTFTYSYDFDNDGVFEIVGSSNSSVSIPAALLQAAGVHTIHGRITDSDNASTDVYATVTVDEVSPALTVTGAATATEGEAYSLSMSAADPGDDVITSWVVDWGDGTSETVVGASATLTHVFTSDGTFTIQVTAVDADGSYSAELEVAVANAPPTLSDLALSSVDEGQESHLTGTISDPAGDVLTLTVTWSDGNVTSETLAAGATGFDLRHRFSGNGPVSAQVVVSDGPANDPATLSVSGLANAVVSNVAPTIEELGFAAGAIAEGAQATLTGRVSDPDSTDGLTVTIVWGDGQTSTVAADPATGLFSASHTYHDQAGASASDVFTATVTVTDDDGGTSTAATASVTLNNAAPTLADVAFSSNAVEEGEPVTLSGRIVDAGQADVHAVTVDWGDGTTSTATVNPDRTFSATHIFADNPATGTSFMVVITVADDDGGSISVSTSITVNDVPPSVIVSGANEAVVGAAYDVTFSATDVGTDTVAQWRVDWGDGTVDVLDGTATTASHVYMVPGAYAVSVSATDEESAEFHEPVTRSVDAAVLATEIGVGGPYAVSEGGSLTLSATAPGTVESFTWSVNGRVVAAAGGGVTLSWAQLEQLGIGDDGVFAVSVTANYAGGVSVAAAQGTTLTVTNAVPVIVDVTVVPDPVDEGQQVTLGGRIVDPGNVDIHTVTVAWGDGTTSQAAVNPDLSFTAVHVYGDNPSGNAAYSVTVTVVDDDGDSSSASTTIVVDDVTPTVVVTGASDATVGTAYDLAFSVIDPGTDTVTQWRIDWGDGTVEFLAGSATGASHVYELPATYTVSVGVADEDSAGSFHSAATRELAVSAAPTEDTSEEENRRASALLNLNSLSEMASDAPVQGIVPMTPLAAIEPVVVTGTYTPPAYSATPQLQSGTYIFSYDGGTRGSSRPESNAPQGQTPQGQTEDGSPRPQSDQEMLQESEPPSRREEPPRGEPGDGPQGDETGRDETGASETGRSETGSSETGSSETGSGDGAGIGTGTGAGTGTGIGSPERHGGLLPRQAVTPGEPEDRARYEAAEWVFLGALAAIPARAANDGRVPSGWSVIDKSSKKRRVA